MKRIFCISDTHLTSPDLNSKSLFPRAIDGLPIDQAERVYHAIRTETHLAFLQAISWAKAQAPWDIAIHFGDVTGGYQEKGVHHPSVEPLASMCMHMLRQVSANVRVCIGNHETGYTHPGAIPGSGMTRESLDACTELFGSLYWADQVENLLFIGVCSPLLTYRGDDPGILAHKHGQAAFIAEQLETHRGRPWVLCAHEPSSSEHLADIIEPYMDTLQAFLYGDKHAPWWGNMKRWVVSNGFITRLLPKRKRVKWQALQRGILCPSTAPLWWKGHQALEVHVDSVSVSSYQILFEVSEATQQLPTSSFWRCVLWMIHPVHRLGQEKVPQK